jgi:hypothetical protein
MKFLAKLQVQYGIHTIKKNGFWFVDIPRTSSTSIRSELGKAYGKASVIEKKHATKQIFKDHTPAIEMQNILGKKDWESLFTFTLVRNPWDRVLSIYNYRKKVDSIPHHISFEEYVTGLIYMNEKYFSYYGYRYSALDFITGKNGELLVDYIGKFENRVSDLNYISDRIKCKSLGALVVQKASVKNTHYSEYYTPKTKEIIANIYSKDIEKFNYKFI